MMQEGTILSFTVVHHPPEGFPTEPRTIALLELSDGTRVTGLLVTNGITPVIGQHVQPRMRLSRITSEKLRIYEPAYEITEQKPVEQKVFPGYILALTGPSGVGKSTVTARLTRSVGRFAAPVPIVTTRKAKDTDEKGEYIHVSAEEFMDLKKSGALVAATDIPSKTEQRWYGYRASDIAAIWAKGKIPVVITEMGLLQELSRHYGRRSILSCGLLPPGRSKRTMLSALLHRLRSRGRDTEESIEDRMKNAERDLAFFRDQKELFDHLLVNEDLDTVVNSLKGHVMELVKA